MDVLFIVFVGVLIQYSEFDVQKPKRKGFFGKIRRGAKKISRKCSRKRYQNETYENCSFPPGEKYDIKKKFSEFKFVRGRALRLVFRNTTFVRVEQEENESHCDTDERKGNQQFGPKFKFDSTVGIGQFSGGEFKLRDIKRIGNNLLEIMQMLDEQVDRAEDYD